MRLSYLGNANLRIWESFGFEKSAGLENPGFAVAKATCEYRTKLPPTSKNVMLISLGVIRYTIMIFERVKRLCIQGHPKPLRKIAALDGWGFKHHLPEKLSSPRAVKRYVEEEVCQLTTGIFECNHNIKKKIRVVLRIKSVIMNFVV